MDINFIADPNLIPRPRSEIRIESIHASVLEDQKRIRIELGITAFTPLDKPNIDIEVFDPSNNPAGSLAIIETMHNNVSLIFHLREDQPPAGDYRIRADLYYDEGQVQNSAEVTIRLPETHL